MKAKQAASTIQRLCSKKANYGLATEVEIEKAKEEMNDRRTMDEELDHAIRAEEAAWMETEEAEQAQWEQALMEEEDQLHDKEPKRT
eukprot:10822401-Ditylum_brightwellii.AAC.2